MDDLGSYPAAGGPETEHIAPANAAQRLATIEKSLEAFRGWGNDVKAQITGLQAGFQVLQNGQDVLAGEITGLVSGRREASQQAAAGGGALSAIDPVFGYQPTAEQLAILFGALAEWQAAAPELTKGGTASFNTSSGGQANYDYATPGDVSKLARTAGVQGLSHWHREIVLETYSVVRTYLVHKAGGFIYSDVPLLQKENKMLSPIQSWAVANTAAKRLGILSVLGILPGDADDAGNPATGQGRSIETRRGPVSGPGPGVNKPPPLPAENIRRVGATTTSTPAPAAGPVSAAGPAASD